MDGYSHHEQKKRYLQVSKYKGWVMQGGQSEAKMEARDDVKERKHHCYVYTCVHIVSYTLSANNSALCLGYK